MIFLSFLLPLFAFASSPDLPAPGQFTYQGRFEVLQKRVAEAVNTTNEQGRARVKELRGSGYACVSLTGDLTRCTGFVETKGTETEVAFLVNRTLQGRSLEFFAPEGEPSLTVDGEIYQEWAAPQKVVFLGKTHESYRYQILKNPELHKLYFGEEGVVRRPEGFGYVQAFQRQLSRNVLASYIVSGLFE
jgi:hypothetical protein